MILCIFSPNFKQELFPLLQALSTAFCLHWLSTNRKGAAGLSHHPKVSFAHCFPYLQAKETLGNSYKSPFCKWHPASYHFTFLNSKSELTFPTPPPNKKEKKIKSLKLRRDIRKQIATFRLPSQIQSKVLEFKVNLLPNQIKSVPTDLNCSWNSAPIFFQYRLFIITFERLDCRF